MISVRKKEIKAWESQVLTTDRNLRSKDLSNGSEDGDFEMELKCSPAYQSLPESINENCSIIPFDIRHPRLDTFTKFEI